MLQSLAPEAALAIQLYRDREHTRDPMLPYNWHSMSFQWLELRISEERERRNREAKILARLPGAMDELGANLASCVHAYTAAFTDNSVLLTQDGPRLTVAADSKRVEVLADPQLPGLQIQRDGVSMPIQIGILPGEGLFYLDLGADQYLSMDELTRKILDRVLFPNLKEM
jgi:hypothetical protein